MSVTKVDVSILGRHFTVNTPTSEQQTLENAVALLNSKIAIIEKSGQIIDHDKMIIMAALNITHNYLKIKVTNDLDIDEFERRMRVMTELCDDVLKDKT